MKKFYNLIKLQIISAVCFLSCDDKPITHSLIIIPDLTEDYFSGFTISEFKKLSCITHNSNNGENVRIVPITELGFNKSFETEIQKVGNLLMGNDFDRTYEIDYYYSYVDSILKYFDGQKKTRSESVIFKLLAEELNKLSQSKVDKRTLIVNTDFMENSIINFYDPEIMNDIKRNPEKIRGSLLSKYPISDLTGIEIYFVYLPIDRWDSKRFEILSGFYKKLFESFGAKVHIVGNL